MAAALIEIRCDICVSIVELAGATTPKPFHRSISFFAQMPDKVSIFLAKLLRNVKLNYVIGLCFEDK